MTFSVRELQKAKADKRRIFEWIHQRSRSGAIAWLAAYDRMIDSLKANADTCAEAYESADLERDVRQALFKTRRGRVFRALFVIESAEVLILRIRSAGQRPLDSDDVGTT